MANGFFGASGAFEIAQQTRVPCEEIFAVNIFGFLNKGSECMELSEDLISVGDPAMQLLFTLEVAVKQIAYGDGEEAGGR
jgi:hypothetical protein